MFRTLCFMDKHKAKSKKKKAVITPPPLKNSRNTSSQCDNADARRKRQTPPSAINRTSQYWGCLEHVFCGKVPFAPASRGHEFHLRHVGVMHYMWSVDSIDRGLPVIHPEGEVFVEKISVFVRKGER